MGSQFQRRTPSNQNTEKKRFFLTNYRKFLASDPEALAGAHFGSEPKKLVQIVDAIYCRLSSTETRVSDK